MHQFPNTVTVFRLHFCFLIEKIAKGKKPPVSLLEHIYGSTDFLDQPSKCSQKRLIIVMFFLCNIYRNKRFHIVSQETLTTALSEMQ